MSKGRSWNKDSKTPRDYSKEYNAPGSKEQEERNKRKRDKRKHDDLYGECPEGTELHHINGIENDEVECVLVSKNRGRKEKSRKKDGEVVIRIKRKNAEVKKLKEVSSFYGGDADLPVSKQKKTPKDKNLDDAAKEFVKALRQTKVGAMDIRDAADFDKRMLDVLEKAIDNRIKDIADDYKVYGRKNIEEQEQPDLTSPDLTVAQFVDILRSREMKYKLQSLFGGSTAKAVTAVIGSIIGNVIIPGGGGIAGAVAGGAAGIAIDKVLDRLRNNLPKALMALQNMPDEGSEGSAFAYFDLDDEAQSLTRGGASKDGPLLKQFQKYLFGKYKEKFSNLSDEDLQKPLASFIEKSASEYLNDFLESTAKTDKGDVVNRIISKP